MSVEPPLFMKELTIVRHAKSSWSSPGLSDHDRPLNSRGERDAPKIGMALKERGVSPDVILSSTANRALTTARIIAEQIGYDPDKIVEKSEIYLASTQALMTLVNQIDEGFESAMIFGHNPGFHSLADGLLPWNDSIDHFPTCCVAHISFEAETWGEIGAADGSLEFNLYPKML